MRSVRLAAATPLDDRDRAAFLAGAPSAVGVVFGSHFGAVAAAIGDMVAGAASETVLHEVGLRLMTDEKLRARLDGGDLGAGLVALGRSHALDYRRRRLPEGALEEDATIEVDDSARDAADAQQAVAHFKSTKVPAEWQPLYEARFVAHRSADETARALGLGPAQLRSRERRLRARLWRYLRDDAPARACPHRRNVDQHFAGEILAHDERVMRRHLPGCADCRRRYERLLAGARIDPQALPPPERLARGLGLAAPPPAHRWIAWACGAVALAACVLLFAGPTTARAGFGAAVVHPSDASELFVYRARDGGPTWRLASGAHVAAGEPLAFAYRNPEGWTRLYVFASDEHGRMYWYYPAGGEAAEEARPQQIHFSGAPATLEATATPQVDGRRLTLTALFARDELALGDIAAQARAGTLEAWQKGRGRVVRIELVLDR